MRFAASSVFSRQTPRLLYVSCICVLCLLAGSTHALEPPANTTRPDATADLAQVIDDVIESGKFDHSIIQAIQKQPRNERPDLAIRVLQSPNSAMRYHALRILKDFPPDIVAQSVRQLLNDESPDNQIAAALYLAKKANDGEARQLLLDGARAQNPAVALPALKALGLLGGETTEETLLAILRTDQTLPKVRDTAILLAGQVKAKSCLPALVEFLDNRKPSKRFRKDPARVCDLAASALEMMYDVYRLDAPGAYFTATVEERDKGIAAWKEWYASRATSPDANPRMTHLSAVIESSLEALGGSPVPAMRKRIKNRLQHAFKTRLCLGDLPGVDAVVSPSVRDLWRILQVFDQDLWYGHLNTWHDLQLAFSQKFLSDPKTLPKQPDAQALAFIRFARTAESFPRIWIWSFCRNFPEAFPASKHLENVRTIQAELETEFAAKKMQVVLHGHIAVLEPKRGPVRHGNMVPDGYTALHMQLQREPSNWSLYGPAVEYYKKWHEEAIAANDPKKLPYIHDFAFKQQMKLYTDNEWPYLGNTIYQWRVLKNAKRAIEFADKALILNPGNAKAYAIRGMIRVVSSRESELAERDLKKAYELDPDSLGDEPETVRAIAFLVERALDVGEKPRAREYLKTLGRLRAYGAQQPFSETLEFKAVRQRATAP